MAEKVTKPKALMQILVTLFILVACSFILTAPNFLIPSANDTLQKAAIGWLGAIIGYWLA